MMCIRSFDVNKPQLWVPGKTQLTGAVVGGTLQQGVLAVGDWVEIRPGRLTINDGVITSQPLFTRVILIDDNLVIPWLRKYIKFLLE
jgi:translation initiation factor 2 subunit 3